MKSPTDSLPEIAEVVSHSVGARFGLLPGDKVISVNGVVPRDILEWHRLVDDVNVDLQILRGRENLDVTIERGVDEPLGIHISSAVFDRIHTCDNHCEFCFIYQLPKGMRRSLYIKDDDYRLSFLYGNFTTLTRFTESDLERVIDENLSPLYVSIHASDPHVRAEMLRNVRGGFSLRWAQVMMEHNIDVRAQIVVCPGVNDGDILDDTLAELLESFSQLDSIAIVPLGLSRFNTESRMRVHTKSEAEIVIDIVEKWQQRYERLLGNQVIHLADEFYLVADRPVPPREHYGQFPMLEDGVGLVRSFVDSYQGLGQEISGRHDGFFASVDGLNPTAYTQVQNPVSDTSLRPATATQVTLSGTRRTVNKPLAVVTGSYGAQIFREYLKDFLPNDVAVIEVVNSYFGGNTAVAGLMTFADIHAALTLAGTGLHYLLPDVCLNNGVFLDGSRLDELQQDFDVEVIATSGAALRRRLSGVLREKN